MRGGDRLTDSSLPAYNVRASDDPHNPDFGSCTATSHFGGKENVTDGR
jgi:hypothetical protein